MNQEHFKRCIDANNACAAVCDITAASGMHEANIHAMEDCVSLSRDCAEICRLAASYMERGSKMASAVLLACIEACERCRKECDKYMMDYCEACAAACRKCAVECQALIASLVDIEHHHSRDSAVAGLRN
jgi:hypothetical protein